MNIVIPSNPRIPYVISMGHPDYKRPRVSQKFEVALNISDAIQKCINDLADRINDSLPKKDWKDMSMIYRYHSEKRDAYIENSFWEAQVFLPMESRWLPLEALQADFGDLAIKLAKEKVRVTK